MRNEKELFELMLKHQDLFAFGMCGWLIVLNLRKVINHNEYFLLRNYLRKNKPKDLGQDFWWEIGKTQPRIDWINEQIEKL